jgi:hypothetical protein
LLTDTEVCLQFDASTNSYQNNYLTYEEILKLRNKILNKRYMTKTKGMTTVHNFNQVNHLAQ